MPKFTRKIENNRPLISVVMSKDKEHFKSIAGSNDIEQLNNNRFIALVDTGATSCTITKKVVDRLGLDIVGKKEVSSASHTLDVNIYNIWLSVPAEKLIGKQDDTGQITPP